MSTGKAGAKERERGGGTSLSMSRISAAYGMLLLHFDLGWGWDIRNGSFIQQIFLNACLVSGPVLETRGVMVSQDRCCSLCPYQDDCLKDNTHCKENRTLAHCSWDCKLAQSLWKIGWRFFKRLKTEPTGWPNNPTPSYRARSNISM